MTVTIEKLENNQVKLNIEVESAVSALEYDKACKKLAQRVNVPGFRQGKAPKNILEKYVGIDAIQREVVDSLLPSILENISSKSQFKASATTIETLSKLTLAGNLQTSYDVNSTNFFRKEMIYIGKHKDALIEAIVLRVTEILLSDMSR